MKDLHSRFRDVRNYTDAIFRPLAVEDYIPQPAEFVSPPKWNLGHTTWFFETFILQPYDRKYKVFNENYPFLFNSYYNNAGSRILRSRRGDLTRPTVAEVYEYRKYIDEAMRNFILNDPGKEITALIELGLQHEQQHQELFWTDLKYTLGLNPLFPAYNGKIPFKEITEQKEMKFISMEKGIYDIGFEGNGFCYDNELGKHKVYLHNFAIAERPVTNAEYLEFIEGGGYGDFNLWHDEGWKWVNENEISAPLYWYKIDGKWMNHTLKGLKPVVPGEAVKHISFYEAFAFAEWKGMRLPTEFEWEAASDRLGWGKRWEWTQSAYLPYPGFRKAPGAVGEYNGKFMVNQMVLRGGSVATSPGHSRKTYRNFFHPDERWQFTGIRLAK
ncbi:MAG: ergothioneine biosynthesis protein EgtB [Chlorobi bacterium]|nr:ergothioneine biosynthesis protein EgtB [Chlorobiota bacterium]